ncbi:MAG: TetR/AcrR family transcriptional regulator [Bdellovibrionota bacterium]
MNTAKTNTAKINTANINTAKIFKHTEDLSLCNASSKERVLAAALKLFVGQGYFNTNIPDLSKESRCSVGSIYHHFKNKEEIAKALYDLCISIFRKELEKSISGITDTEEFIKKLVKAFLRFSEVNVQTSKYIWLCRHSEFLDGLIMRPTTLGFDNFGRMLTRVLKQGIKENKIRALNANIIWSIIFGIPLEYVRDWLDGYNKIAPSKVADEIADACWRALKI